MEPYKIKMVESISTSTKEQREDWIEKAKYNLFNLSSDKVTIDLLTDSGTGSMSDKQWAEILQGDESYAGSSSFTKLKETIQNLTGFEYMLPTHQGRAAENILFSALIEKGNVVPGNSHFDTTKGHIEFRKAIAVDCTVDEAYNTTIDYPFKGNIDIGKLEKTLQSHVGNIPFVILTVTCNSAGGQPVSLQNIKEVSRICKREGIPLYFDSARFAENAYFIKIREAEFENWTIREIVREMFSYADGMTMSGKKDGIVNMGGFVAMHDPELYLRCSTFCILYEGFTSYGGMSGRDMGALAVGLLEATEFEYLNSRIGQVKYMYDRLISFGIPIQRPFGGHAIYIDANKFLEDVPREEYRAQTLAIELYIESGVRGVEIGTILADRDPETKQNRYPKVEFVRFAIPRRTYTLSHLEYVVQSLKAIYDKRHEISHGYAIQWEAPIMRHFTVQLEKVREIES